LPPFVRRQSPDGHGSRRLIVRFRRVLSDAMVVFFYSAFLADPIKWSVAHGGAGEDKP